MGKLNHGIDPMRLNEYATEIKEIQNAGTEIAIVIGGGNIFRGFCKQRHGSRSSRLYGNARYSY